MFSDVRQATTGRLSEVRQLLETIKTLESQVPTQPDSAEVLILRGLFYVHLYATLEYTVNRAVEILLVGITELKICTVHFEPKFLSVALDPDFSSLSDAGAKVRWAKRIAFLNKQFSADETSLHSGIFSTYLQNIWSVNLQQLFDCLSINHPVVPDTSLSPYIDEIVNKRNAVAHGRESPAKVGRGTRSPDLQTRLNAVSSITMHVIECFSRHLAERNFVRIEHKELYPA